MVRYGADAPLTTNGRFIRPSADHSPRTVAGRGGCSAGGIRPLPFISGVVMERPTELAAAAVNAAANALGLAPTRIEAVLRAVYAPDEDIVGLKAIAAHLGVSRTTLWRLMRSDKALRRLVARDRTGQHRAAKRALTAWMYGRR